MPCDEAVRALDGDRPPGGGSRYARIAERLDQLYPGGGARRAAAVRTDETPRCEPLLPRYRREQRFGVRVVERQKRDLSASVEPRDDTRREAAEASAAVVQQHRPVERHEQPFCPGASP